MVIDKWNTVIRRLQLALNRLRFEFQLRRKNNRFKIIIPERHRDKIKFLKYATTIIALFSSFLIFSSVWVTFFIGLIIYLVSLLLEKTSFVHPHLFIHALPDFELDSNKWLGCGFGYIKSPNGDQVIPLVSMMITDLDYAKKIASLFLKWTGGEYADKDKNIQIIVVVTSPNEYIFLCYPNPKRPLARKFFQSARDRLRNKSLEDEVSEQHMTLILGKRCELGKNSYFPQFRARHRAGIPVAFDFVLPPFDTPSVTRDIPAFTFFDFTIKDKSELTRKDLAFDAVRSFRHGGTWQGPERT